MERTRLAAVAALFVVLSVGGAALASVHAPGLVTTAVVTWPVSMLLVSEVQTGGGSASDEFAEITNVGPGPVDLAGLEIVYVTATGSTVTRKAAWTASLLLEPGRHLFIANSLGIYAGLADATYTGGFAATGGAIVLRAIGGAPVDAVGWGDATNAFVESSAIAAPAAGASVERRPAGLAGNTQDTNDNAADFLAQASPNPQSIAAPPVPAPGATASPAASASAAPSATPTSTVEPSFAASAVPSPSPVASEAATAEPTLAPTAEPTASQTLAPTGLPSATLEGSANPSPTDTPTPAPPATAEPTPEFTSAPTAVPTPTPLPAMTIVEARGLPDGSPARIEGVMTTHLGALESARKAFVQDETGGIAMYLDAAAAVAIPADTLVSVTGTIDERFAERTLRANVADVVVLGEQQRPQPLARQTGEVGEGVEGLRVLVQGVTVGAASELSDGTGLMVDDGTGPVRVIVAPGTLGSGSVSSGTSVVAVGPVGQRDSSGTGLSGYRIHVTEPGDFEVFPTPTPAPTSSPSPTAVPTSVATSSPTAAPASATPTSKPTPSPTVRPTATPGPTSPPVLSIQEARAATIGTPVTVRGVVTAEAGRLGLPPLLAIADGSGGIVVRLPDGVAAPNRGTTVTANGKLADPYGQLELRPAISGFAANGHGSLPSPVRLGAKELGERTEGRLAELTGTATAGPKKSASGDFTVDLVDGSGEAFRIVCDASSGIDGATFTKGATYRLVGLVGQRASRKGALDGYRVYLRDRGDVTKLAGPPGPGQSQAPGASPGPGASQAPSAVSIDAALAYADGTPVVVEGTVTAPADLLDSTRRRIVIQDGSGAIEILVPSGSQAPAVGTRVRVDGTRGIAYGAPRIGAKDIESVGRGSVDPTGLGRAPGERDEWKLVRISGTVEKVERLGDRWRAEIVLAGGGRAPVHGQAGAGIPSTAIVTGRRITVTGIVRRPYPTATDRRFAVLPRDGGDVAIGPGGKRDGGTAAGGPSSVPGGSSATPPPGRSSVDITPDTDLAVLADHVGKRVRVGGLVTSIGDDGFDLDDGTALARVRLEGSMAGLLAHLHEGEAIAATGRVELVGGSAIVVVDDDGSLFRVGSLGQALPIAGAGAGASQAPEAVGSVTADATGLTPDIAPTSVLALAGLALLSVAATVVRRRLVQRRLRALLVARLAGLGAGEAAVPAPAGAADSPIAASAGPPSAPGSDPDRGMQASAELETEPSAERRRGAPGAPPGA